MKEPTLNSEFWRFLSSSILITLSGTLGFVVDGIIVGNLIGEDGVSAINLNMPLLQFLYTISMLLSTGAGMLVGMEIGKKDFTRAAYVFTVSMVSCMVVGLLFSVAGLETPGIVAGFLCNNERLLEPTTRYLVPMLMGTPVYMMMWALSNMVSVDGSPRLVSIAIVIDNVVNLAFDVILIQGLSMGIAGSSIASIIGHLVGIAIMCRHFFYKDNNLHFSRTHSKPAFGEIISQGAPLAVASICLTLLFYSANAIVLSSMGHVGIFAFAVCLNLLQIYNLFMAGVCRTMQSLGAIQVGKGDNNAFRFLLVKSFRFITVSVAVICILVWIEPSIISRLFGATEGEMMTESNHALRILAFGFIPFCYIYPLMIVYKLYNHHKMALFISFALSLTVIPVLWTMSRLAPNLLWYSYLIAYAIEALMIFVLHKLTHVRFELSQSPKPSNP